MELYTSYGDTDLKRMLLGWGIFFDTDERPSMDARISFQLGII